MKIISPLKIGDKLLIQDEDDNVWLDHWSEVMITSISNCFNPRNDNKLDPYICIRVKDTNAQVEYVINFTLYCQLNHVKLLERDI